MQSRHLNSIIFISIALLCAFPFCKAENSQNKPLAKSAETNTAKAYFPFTLTVHGVLNGSIFTESSELNIVPTILQRGHTNTFECFAWQSAFQRDEEVAETTDSTSAYRFEIEYADGVKRSTPFQVNSYTNQRPPSEESGTLTTRPLPPDKCGEFLIYLRIAKEPKSFKILQNGVAVVEFVKGPAPEFKELKVETVEGPHHLPMQKFSWEIDNPALKPIGVGVFVRHGNRPWMPHGTYRHHLESGATVKGSCEEFDMGKDPITFCITVTSGVQAWERIVTAGD